MLIVLPPSETKAPGGAHAAMSLSFPQLDPVREALMRELASSDADTLMAELAIPASKREEAEENLRVATAPVMPAIERYTGVLFDALSPATLPETALEHLAIGSALFGVVRAHDLIPRYRLSGGSKLGGKTMKAQWGTRITDVLSAEDFVLDMRSGAYQQLGPVPGAATVRVEQADTGKVVSHFNKQYKGELARALALSDSLSSIRSTADVAELAKAQGFNLKIEGEQITLLV